MKKLHTLLCLLSFFALSCNKGSDSNVGNITYTVNGIADFTIPASGSYVLPIAVNYASGTQQPVTISVSGLPTGVTAAANPQSGTPTFASTITFTDDHTGSAGTFPIKIKTTTQSGVVKEIPCNMTTIQSCTSTIVGTYTGTDTCDAGQNFTMTVKAGTEANKVVITNFDGVATDVNATLDCSSKTITIPAQTPPGFSTITLSGTGTFDGTNLNLSYSATDGTATSHCLINSHK